MKTAWSPNDNMAARAQQAERQSTSQRQLRSVSQEFEALFLQQMLGAMRSTVPDSDLLGDSRAEETFETMLDEEMSKEMSQAGGIGLADILYKQMVHFVPHDD